MKTIVALLLAASPCVAAVDPWADYVQSYSPGTQQLIGDGSGQLSYFSDPNEALGAPSTAASRTVGATTVVQLGQRGSLTLGFNEPIQNNVPDATSSNPDGYDFTVFGNAIELAFAGSGAFFREPGYVEVAQKQSNGSPGEWFLILPGKLPGSMVGRVDTGSNAAYQSFYADASPTIGSGNPLLAPNQSGSAGGDGFLLERAVRQSSPGVPLDIGAGLYDFVTLNSVAFVRITDVLVDDAAAVVNGTSTGLITTDVDAVADLPGTVAAPEPASLSLLAMSLGLLARPSRQRA